MGSGLSSAGRQRRWNLPPPLGLLWLGGCLHLLVSLLIACTAEPQGVDVSMEVRAEGPHIALARVSVDAAATVRVLYGEPGGAERATPELELTAGEEAEITVLGLRADQAYTLTAQASEGGVVWSSATQALHTPDLERPWPRCEAHTWAPPGSFGPQEVVCTTFLIPGTGRARFGCVDREGHLVFQLMAEEGVDMMATSPLYEGGFASASKDRIDLFDDLGRPEVAWCAGWFQDKTRFVHDFIVGHEIIQLEEGPWAGALAFVTSTRDTVGDELVYGDGVIVFDPVHEVVLWDWTSHGVLGDGVPIDAALDYGRKSLIDNDVDWLHANALVHGLDDGRQFYWVSLRHQDWIIKVDVESDTVEWRLGWEGDFTLVDDLDDPSDMEVDPSQWFYHQHAPELQSHGDGRARFLIFDNGNVRMDEEGQLSNAVAHSRVAEFEIDELTHRARLRWTFGPADSSESSHFYAPVAGDADMLPGGSRVQYVVASFADTPHLGEVSYPEGEVLWALTCDPSDGFYRTMFFPSLYQRNWWHDTPR